MRILFVAMSNSIHTARWISQISDSGYDLHLFPSVLNVDPHPEMLPSVIVHDPDKRSPLGVKLVRKTASLLRKQGTESYIDHLCRVIETVKPDLIHSLETQSAGYCLSEAKLRIKNHFPTWVHSIWGSDLYLFGRLVDHQPKIRRVLENCDFVLCESERDKRLAKVMGYKGPDTPIIQSAGGLDVLEKLNNPSKRTIILVKGYQGIMGRSLVALRSLARAASHLSRFEIIVYSALSGGETDISARLLASDTGLKVTVLPYKVARHELMGYFQRSRIHLGISISDGMPNAMLEAMSAGAFPIQSTTSAADEVITHKKNGFLVPAEDPDVIAKYIIRAVEDDGLVDRAADYNRTLIKKRFNKDQIKTEINSFYSTIGDF